MKQFLGGREKTEWMLKLRTVYSYGLNEKVDICEDDKNVKRFKSDDGIVGKLFPSLPKLFQRHQTCRHVNRKGISILNYKQFIINLNNYLKDDLPNALNYIRVSLASIKKRHLKQIADHTNDFFNDQNSEFFYNQWYLMALNVIETKLFKEPKKIIKISILKYRFNLTFKSKAFDFISLPKILRSKEVCDNLPCNFDVSDILMVVYNLNLSIISNLFNYKQFVLHLNTDEFLKDPNSIKCYCNKYDNSFINNHYGHIITEPKYC